MGDYEGLLNRRGLLVLPALLVALVLGACASPETGRTSGAIPTALPTTVPAGAAPVSPLSPISPVSPVWTPPMLPSAAPSRSVIGTSSPVPLADLGREAVAKQLGVAPVDIRLLQSEPVQWPDACLGAARPGEMCAQVITPGYRLLYDTPKGLYEAHTDERGRSFRVVPASSRG